MTKSILIPALAASIALAAPAAAAPVSDLFKNVKDSVVVVKTEQREVSPWGSHAMVSVGGIGSGVLIAPEGLVLTAAHVVQTAERIEVLFSNGEVLKARVVSSEPSADVALLELESIPSEPIVSPLGDSDAVEVGDEIFIVGAPFGISHTLTVGHISGRRNAAKLFGNFSLAELFQTDAAINKGNSGGPMFNMNGEVIGVVSSIISRSGGFEGLGFVVTSNLARSLVVDERAPWSGMEGFILSGELARIFNLPQSMGLLVQKIAKGSLAERVGLRAGKYQAQIEDQELLLGGDIILTVMGIQLSAENRPKIRARLRGLTPASPVTVTVLRNGRPVELQGNPAAR